jgi:hypothetical protein
VTTEELYLGDGLFVSLVDGWLIKLRAPREHGDDEVFLEPAVFEALIEWHKRTVSKGPVP